MTGSFSLTFKCRSLHHNSGNKNPISPPEDSFSRFDHFMHESIALCDGRVFTFKRGSR